MTGLVEFAVGATIIAFFVACLIHFLAEIREANQEYEWRKAQGPVWHYGDQKGLTYDEYLTCKYDSDSFYGDDGELS